MRYLPIALALTGTLILTTSCSSGTPVSPTQSQAAFSVKARPGTCCKVTGGGFIECNGKTTFGFNATSGESGVTGEVEVVDHTLGYNFHGSTITSVTCTHYDVGNDTSYTITGELAPQSTGYPGTFTLIVRDNGEPGNAPNGTDTFDFRVTSGALAGYERAGVLIGGNIQAHEY